MLDGKVISAVLQSREAYDKVKDYISSTELSPQAQMWLPLISDWYSLDRSANHVDMSILLDRADRELPENHLDSLKSWIRDIPECDSPAHVVSNLLELKRYVKGNELCQVIQSRDKKKLPAILEEYTQLQSATDLGRSEITWTMDDSEMDQLLDRSNLIKIAPKRLNNKLAGGCIRGDHILIFGRPESGKTLFTVNMVSSFLKQDLRVLYVGNEESTYKPRKRIINNLSKMSNDDYLSNKQAAMSAARASGFDNLYICRMYPGTLSEIEDAVKDTKPDVVVLDQIRGIDHPVANGNFTQKLTILGEKFRNMAGKYSFLAVSVTQAGDKTERHGQEPPEWLTMSDIDSNRTGLAGAVDVLLGVGKNSDLDAHGRRAISICKNKNSDSDDSHEGFYVEIDKRLSTVR